MQAAGVGFLLASTNHAGAGAAQDDGAAASGDQFSQLLSDAESQSDHSPAQDLINELAAAVPPTVLVAQEIPAAANPATQLAQLLQRPVTPQEAPALIKKIDAIIAQFGSQNRDSNPWKQLKEQLVQLQASATPKPLGDMIQALPVVQQQAANPTHAPIIHRLLQFMQAALGKTPAKEVPAQADQGNDVAEIVPDVTVQSLQAASFRTNDEPAAIATEDKESHDDVEIVPLSQSVAIPLPQWATEMAQTPEARADLDQAIPPLAINDHDVALPQVDLPDAPETLVEKPKPTNDFMRHLTALADQQPSATMANSQVGQKDILANHGPQVDASVNPVLNPSATGGHSTTHSAQAVQPVLTAPNLINHAPVAEQVHVAIKRASQEGLDSITIQLEPADLGRVEVKMHVAADGQARLAFTVDKAETFDSLSRDARALERSLQEAGIKADTGSMQFNLRQHPNAQAQADFGNHGHSKTPMVPDDEDGNGAVDMLSAIDPAARHYRINIHDGVDIHA